MVKVSTMATSLKGFTLSHNVEHCLSGVISCGQRSQAASMWAHMTWPRGTDSHVFGTVGYGCGIL